MGKVPGRRPVPDAAGSGRGGSRRAGARRGRDRWPSTRPTPLPASWARCEAGEGAIGQRARGVAGIDALRGCRAAAPRPGAAAGPHRQRERIRRRHRRASREHSLTASRRPKDRHGDPATSSVVAARVRDRRTGRRVQELLPREPLLHGDLLVARRLAWSRGVTVRERGGRAPRATPPRHRNAPECMPGERTTKTQCSNMGATKVIPPLRSCNIFPFADFGVGGGIGESGPTRVVVMRFRPGRAHRGCKARNP